MTLVENTATLTVLKIGKGDAGQYTCYASNVAGKDSCSAHLGVQGTWWSEIARAHFNF